MKHFIFLIIAATSLVIMGGCVETGTCSQTGIKISIFPGDYPDPSIIRDGDDFYMIHSSFTYYPGLLIWHSTDLLNWRPIVRAVKNQNYSIFAPELCKVDEKFFIYYPTSGGQNFVITADSIQGPWSQPILMDVNGIDPGHVIDTDGTRYLYTNNGHVIQLTPDGLATFGPNRKVYDGWEYPQEWETEGMWLESPKLLRRGDFFYMVSAEGGTAGPATSHMCVVARSKSALGPWENSPYNPLVHTYSAEEQWWSKGHGTLIDDTDGNWYIVYHSYRKNMHTLGRNTMIESIEWTEDGWPILCEKDGALFKNGGLQESDSYDFLRNYSDTLLWAEWEGGYDNARLWTITAIDTSYQVTAAFNISPGARAGLYLFYNEQANMGEQGDEERLYIRITNNNNLVTTEKSKDGEQWVTIKQGVDLSGYHHNNYKGFYALRPAILITPGVEVEFFSYLPQ
ncbi:MAG TPA: family 43 glycosylhydrolase [Bacteroidaceae bacterium]|nr:family 43 glycosylhydrolase [Bacteroidaceae bacterium]